MGRFSIRTIFTCFLSTALILSRVVAFGAAGGGEGTTTGEHGFLAAESEDHDMTDAGATPTSEDGASVSSTDGSAMMDAEEPEPLAPANDQDMSFVGFDFVLHTTGLGYRRHPSAPCYAHTLFHEQKWLRGVFPQKTLLPQNSKVLILNWGLFDDSDTDPERTLAQCHTHSAECGNLTVAIEREFCAGEDYRCDIRLMNRFLSVADAEGIMRQAAEDGRRAGAGVPYFIFDAANIVASTGHSALHETKSFPTGLRHTFVYDYDHAHLPVTSEESFFRSPAATEASPESRFELDYCVTVRDWYPQWGSSLHEVWSYKDRVARNLEAAELAVTADATREEGTRSIVGQLLVSVGRDKEAVLVNRNNIMATSSHDIHFDFHGT